MPRTDIDVGRRQVVVRTESNRRDVFKYIFDRDGDTLYFKHREEGKKQRPGGRVDYRKRSTKASSVTSTVRSKLNQRGFEVRTTGSPPPRDEPDGMPEPSDLF